MMTLCEERSNVLVGTKVDGMVERSISTIRVVCAHYEVNTQRKSAVAIVPRTGS